MSVRNECKIPSCTTLKGDLSTYCQTHSMAFLGSMELKAWAELAAKTDSLQDAHKRFAARIESELTK